MKRGEMEMERAKQNNKTKKANYEGKEFVQKNGTFLDQSIIHGKGMNFLGKEFKF